MYPTANHLRKSGEIEKLFKRGKSFLTQSIAIRFAPNKLPLTRFAVIVGTKVHKKAVKRNLIKRRIRETLRELLPQTKKGFDIAVIARGASLGKNLNQVKEEIAWIFKKNNLLEDKDK